MREVSHADAMAFLPTPRMIGELRDVADLPYHRRERADANIRRAIGDLRALSLEDTTVLARYYHALAETLDRAVRVLDAIEDAEFEAVKSDD